jgi:hypothetical protein
MPLSNCDFHENRRSGNRTLLRAVNEFLYVYFPNLFYVWAEIL